MEAVLIGSTASGWGWGLVSSFACSAGLDAAALEEFRLLSNINADKDQLLQLVLVGQPELRTTLRAPGLEQFAQRISVDYHLSPLSPQETDGYIAHRLRTAGGDPEIFTPVARRFIHLQAGENRVFRAGILTFRTNRSSMRG